MNRDSINNEIYDYVEAVYNDVKDFIEDWCESGYYEKDYYKIQDEDTFHEYFYGILWNNDSVTGNGSGSYYCSTFKAESALCHNWDILENALISFGYDSYDTTPIKWDPERFDCMIRCSCLEGALCDFERRDKNLMDEIINICQQLAVADDEEETEKTEFTASNS